MKHVTNCPICQSPVGQNIGEHIRREHGEEEFRQAVLKAKEGGMADTQIGEQFGITFRQLERIITEAYGVNISTLKKTKTITRWVPKTFKEETTTVWSYKQRGNWATHDGRYRGNWSPYIPRNVILKYSKPGELVLDYFAGGGTTAVEAKLLGRRCIARDINPACVGLTKENLKFEPPADLFQEHQLFQPDVSVGDARDLSDIDDNSVDLICAHPPYAGIISYSSKVEGDLSQLTVEQFLQEMTGVASESYRILKPGAKCAILIGDTRKHKHVVPIGFQTIGVFLNAGFKLKELVTKRQHNCKTTGFWYDKSIKYNFLLLAHEYLPIFEKPKSTAAARAKERRAAYGMVVPTPHKSPTKRKLDELATMTVWLLPEKDFEKYLNKNVFNRYSARKGYSTISFVAHSVNETHSVQNKGKKKKGLLFIKSPFLNNSPSASDIELYLHKTKELVDRRLSAIARGGFVVLQTRDVRIDGFVEPLAKRLLDTLSMDKLWLKEIVVAMQERQSNEIANVSDQHLRITHQYLLVYEVV